jgi:beta-glucosidase
VGKTGSRDQTELTVRCRLTNRGNRPGEEVVQLYIRDVIGSVTRPVKELKGFQKILLAAGESKEVVFTLQPRDLSLYRRDMSFGPEPGMFQVFVGGNSRDVKTTGFELVENKDGGYDFLLPAGREDL